MDRSLRPFSLTAAALALVIWASLEALRPDPAPRPPPEVQRIDFRITGEVPGREARPGDLGHAERHHDDAGNLDGFVLSALDEQSTAWRLGLRDGDLVRAVNGAPLTSPEALSALAAERSGPRCYSVRRGETDLELCYTFDEPPPVDAEARERARDEIRARLEARRLEREERHRQDPEASAREDEQARDRASAGGPSSERATVTRQALEPYLGGTAEDLERLGRLGRMVLHRDLHGEYDGYRVSAIRYDSLGDQLGIKNGDIVHSLDEIELRSTTDLGRAYEAVRTRSSVCLRGTRRGAAFERCYGIVP